MLQGGHNAFENLQSKSQLCFSGFIFDTIAEVGEHEPAAGGIDDAFTPKESPLWGFRKARRDHNWRQLAGVNDGFFWHKKYITGENIEQVFWQLHIAGYYPGPEVTPESMTALSKQWLKTSRNAPGSVAFRIPCSKQP